MTMTLTLLIPIKDYKHLSTRILTKDKRIKIDREDIIQDRRVRNFLVL